jgi:branched-chain amino acid aminotransferase
MIRIWDYMNIGAEDGTLGKIGQDLDGRQNCRLGSRSRPSGEQYSPVRFRGIRRYPLLQDAIRPGSLPAQRAIPYTVEELTEATRQIIRENRFEQCYIRPIAYIGYGGMGLSYEDCNINVSIAVWHWGEYVGQGTLEKGSRAKVSSYVRQHINSHMSKAKACGNYMLFQMARTEARRDGYDEAILLDTNGFVAEGSVEHIFLVRDGALVTPPLTNLLDGITRDTIIRLARAQDIEVREELFSRDYMLTSDEAFFAGTGAEVTPLVEIDNRKIGDGRRGPLTRAIQQEFFDVVYGRTNTWSAWRTPV